MAQHEPRQLTDLDAVRADLAAADRMADGMDPPQFRRLLDAVPALLDEVAVWRQQHLGHLPDPTDRVRIVELPEVPAPDEDGYVRIQVPEYDEVGGTKYAQLRVDPLDRWGERQVHLLSIGLPVRSSDRCVALGLALLAAGEVTRG